jgi:hypothetical protein
MALWISLRAIGCDIFLQKRDGVVRALKNLKTSFICNGLEIGHSMQ